MRLIVFAALLCVAAASSWSYEKQEDWPGICQTGMRQSPVDLRTEEADRFNMTVVRFQNYNSTGPFNVAGNGKSVRVYGFDGWEQRPYIDGGGLDGRYYLDEVDFHWYRKGEQTGSEHSIDGIHYPIEVQLVHRSTFEGQEHIAVVAVFVQPKKTADTSLYRGIADLLVAIDFAEGSWGEGATVASDKMWFQPRELLPADLSRFYRYEGSLTTPNCDEVVTWTVMEAPLTIPQTWMEYMTDTYAYDPDYTDDTHAYNLTEFVCNQRAQQDLNGRRVILRDPNAPPSIATRSRCALWALVAAVLVFFLLIVYVNLPDGFFCNLPRPASSYLKPLTSYVY